MMEYSMRKLMWLVQRWNKLFRFFFIKNDLSMQWSFGVTCWEVFSLGKNPYPGVDPFSLIRYLERGERLDKPFNEACSQEV